MIDRYDTYIENLERVLAILEEDNTSMVEQIEELETALNNAKKEIAAYERQVFFLDGEVNYLNSTVEDLKKELKDTKFRLEDYRESYFELSRNASGHMHDEGYID